LVVPPIPNFVGWGEGATGRCATVDYAGLTNATVEHLSGGQISFGTTMQGLVLERPLADGRATVTVLLVTDRALTWVNACEDFATSPLLFGARAADVLSAGRAPPPGDSSLLLGFTNTPPGAPLPHFLHLMFLPHTCPDLPYPS